MNKATDTQQVIGTMTGNRGIQFMFTMEDGSKKKVILDFYGNGSNLNGATYAEMEAVALRAIASANVGGVESFTHFLIG